MANITANKVILRVFHIVYNVASGIHGAATLYAKHMYCLLDINKYNKHTVAVGRMDHIQKDKNQMPDRPGVWQPRLRVETIQTIRCNATLRHESSSPRNGKARRHLLATAGSTPPPYAPRHISFSVVDLHANTSTVESLQGLGRTSAPFKRLPLAFEYCYAPLPIIWI